MENNYRDKEQDRRIGVVEKHIIITNTEIGDIKADIAGIKKDILWLKWAFRFMITTQVASILALVKLLFK